LYTGHDANAFTALFQYGPLLDMGLEGGFDRAWCGRESAPVATAVKFL
jgi:hypothetical protein